MGLCFANPSSTPELIRHQDTATKYIDLLLPKDKLSAPFKIERNAQESFGDAAALCTGGYRKAVGTTDAIFFHGDTGLFGTVFQAWSNHWNLRTSPEDWWLPMLTKVAKEVYYCADAPDVRQLFVAGREGKKTLGVQLSSWSIHDIDYVSVFNEFSRQIDANICVPGYVNAVTADFTTTTPTQVISSHITLMKSFQKYFEYEMCLVGCGLKGLEMCGAEDDWARLSRKLQILKNLLLPVEETLRLQEVFNTAAEVFHNLHETYLNKNPEAMRKFWADVLIQGKEYEYGPSGFGGEVVDAYNGWLVKFTTGRSSIKDLRRQDLSALTTCPVKVTEAWKCPPVANDYTFVGGMLGYSVHEETPNGAVSLQPAHGWCMFPAQASTTCTLGSDTEPDLE